MFGCLFQSLGSLGSRFWYLAVFGAVQWSWAVFGSVQQSFFFIFAKVRRKIMTQEFNIKKVLMQQSLGIRISLGHAASRI